MEPAVRAPCGDNSRIVRVVLRNINGRPRRVAPTASGQAALRSDFRNENQSHAPLFLLFREKSRLRMLCVCKRTHNAFAALPTFHGIYGERTSVSGLYATAGCKKAT